MMGMLVLIFAVAVLDLAENGIFVSGLGFRRNVAPRSNTTVSACTDHDALMYSHEFHNCFIDRKYKDHAQDLENIVDRILDHSDICIRNSSRKCRPDYQGFMVVMDKVIFQMKDYCFIYLENISHGRDKIKDLGCVETNLSNETYQRCFKEVFQEGTHLSEEFQKRVEKAISCTNKSHKPCSRAAKTSLNRLVRTILRVPQPGKEDIEEDKPKPKPWRWYDYIIQPIISFWKSIRSFFGF